jgi:YidC/Oxa1 family membrane protein insertase
MGIVLLLLTILVKLIVYPLQRKSYISSANMRVLRPKVDEINKKYPKPEDAMMKQQEMMQLYSQYGVSPMGGCLPMLIQMPVWIALFNFIPNAIELRGQSFLWADDLSTYDDIINWGTDLWLIGDHISLFCVLWCVSTFGNTWISMRQQKDTMMPEQQQAMGMMKWFSYLMPVIFFFSFNGYSAGLNYYYFLSGLIGILMMWYLKKTTDDKKLLQKLEERYARKKANPKKASSMMEKLQALQERQQEILRQQEAARNYNKEENKRYNK